MIKIKSLYLPIRSLIKGLIQRLRSKRKESEQQMPVKESTMPQSASTQRGERFVVPTISERNNVKEWRRMERTVRKHMREFEQVMAREQREKNSRSS